MPRYFFHVHNDSDTIDEEGTVLPDAGAARTMATREARHLAAESVKEHGHLILDHYVRVTDELGDVVATVRFEDVVRVVRGI